MIFQREIIVILSGMAPISEVRGAIPLGIIFFGFSPLKTYLLAVLGNLIPILPALFLLNRLADFLMRRHYFFNRFFSWLFDYTRSRHADHFHYWGWAPFALFVFVAIPLPMTGAWSGVVAAFIFGIPFWRGALAIFLGVLAAASITLILTTLGVFTYHSVFLL